jgi:hypothetical protein
METAHPARSCVRREPFEQKATDAASLPGVHDRHGDFGRVGLCQRDISCDADRQAAASLAGAIGDAGAAVELVDPANKRRVTRIDRTAEPARQRALTEERQAVEHLRTIGRDQLANPDV